MSETLTLSVPEAVPSVFVVAMREPPRDPRAVLRNRISGRVPATLGAVIGDLLDAGTVRIEVQPAGSSPWYAAFGAAAIAAVGVSQRTWHARHHVIVSCRDAPITQPSRAQAVRAIARTLAAAGDGLIFDPASRQVLPGIGSAPEPEGFRLCDDWLAMSVHDPADRPGAVDGSPPQVALTQRTTGLSRFGVPELALPDSSADQVLAGISLLRGVAVALLRDFWSCLAGRPAPPRPRSWRCRATIELGAAEIWQYWGRVGLEMWRAWRNSHPGEQADGRIRVRLAIPPGASSDPPALLVAPEQGTGPDAGWLRIAAGPAAPARAAPATAPS